MNIIGSKMDPCGLPLHDKWLLIALPCLLIRCIRSWKYDWKQWYFFQFDSNIWWLIKSTIYRIFVNNCSYYFSSGNWLNPWVYKRCKTIVRRRFPCGICKWAAFLQEEDFSSFSLIEEGLFLDSQVQNQCRKCRWNLLVHMNYLSLSMVCEIPAWILNTYCWMDDANYLFISLNDAVGMSQLVIVNSVFFNIVDRSGNRVVRMLTQN